MHASFAREVQRFLGHVVGRFTWQPALGFSAWGLTPPQATRSKLRFVL
jgi:hypothetical protein